MIVGFSKHGKGQGSAAIDYLLSKDDREIAPVILEGDPDLVLNGIDQNPNKWKYTSGVLSFAPEDIVTEEKERQLIADFEETAFAGIDFENRPQGLWVRHQDKDHHEMHFVYPRQLNDLRSYNMRPPSDQGRYDAFRNVHNLENGWADPDDPERQRGLSLPNSIAKDKEGKKDIREALHNWAEQRVEAGVIDSRQELIEQLQEQGFNVPRAGKDYITIEREGEKVRLKGPIYSATFSSRSELGNDFQGRKRDYQAALSEKLEKSRERLASYNAKRAEQNQERYGRAEPALEKGNTLELVENSRPKLGDLSAHIDRHLRLGGISNVEIGPGIGGVGESSERDQSRKEAAQRDRMDTLRGQDLYADFGQRTPPVPETQRGLVHSEVERQGMENERDFNDELNGRHWAIAARKRVNDIREKVDSTIGFSRAAANGRKPAVNDRKSINQHFAGYVDRHRKEASRIFGSVHKQIERLGNRIEQLKTRCQPMIDRAQKAAQARVRKLTPKGFSR